MLKPSFRINVFFVYLSAFKYLVVIIDSAEKSKLSRHWDTEHYSRRMPRPNRTNFFYYPLRFMESVAYPKSLYRPAQSLSFCNPPNIHKPFFENFFYWYLFVQETFCSFKLFFFAPANCNLSQIRGFFNRSFTDKGISNDSYLIVIFKIQIKFTFFLSRFYLAL